MEPSPSPSPSLPPPADDEELGDLLVGRHRLLGYRVDGLGDGHSRVTWRPGPELGNPVGMVHGGFVGVVIDDTCGTAVVSTMDRLRSFPTASMHIDFLRGIPVGGTYTCLGTVVRAGRRLTVADATIEDADGRLLARGTCTFAM